MNAKEQRQALLAMLREARRRAKERGVVFDIRPDQVPWPADGKCPVLEVPLERNKGIVMANSPSLDRIHSDLGYIKDNVRVVSWRINNLKSNLTTEEIENLLLYVKGYL